MAINMYGSTYSTKNRVTGLNSGMDTDTLIKSLTAVEQLKIDKVGAERTKLQWKQDAYSAINATLLKLRSDFMSVLNPSKNVFSTTAYKAKTTNLADNKFFQLSAGSSALLGKYKITQTKMAEVANVAGDILNTRSAEVASTNGTFLKSTAKGAFNATDANGLEVTGNTKLSDLADSDGERIFAAGTKVSIAINGEPFVFNENATINDMVAKVNAKMAEKKDTDAAGTMATMSFDETTKELTIKSDVIGTSTQLNLLNLNDGKFFGTAIKDISTGAAKKVSVLSDANTLKELAQTMGISNMFSANGKLEFSVNGQSFSFDKTDTIQDMMATVNQNTDAKVNMTFNAEKGIFNIRSKVSGTQSQIDIKNVGESKMFGAAGASATGIREQKATDYVTLKASDTLEDIARKTGKDLNAMLNADGKFEFKVNGQTLSFDKKATVEDINKKLTELNTGVTLKYSEISDKFEFMTKSSGSMESVTIENADSEDTVSFFGIVAGANDTGEDAYIKINGSDYSSRNNTFTIDGMSFTITGNMAATDPEINFSVNQNVDQVVDRVKEFVAEYNKFIEQLNVAYTEKSNRKYPPLSDTQRSEFSAKEIEAWDIEAKKGLLYNDPNIRKLISSATSALYTAVGDTGLRPIDIGLNAGAYQFKAANGGQGKITLDETKLREALEKDPDAVAKVMAQASTSTTSATKFNESGFVARFSDAMLTYSSAVRSNETLPATERIKKLDTRIDDLKYAMYVQQEKMYLKYAQMETMLGKLNSQQDWMTSQLSSLYS